MKGENGFTNPQVPVSPLATARIELVLANQDQIVPNDDGLWQQVRNGLSKSLMAIFWSLSWVIFGVLFLLPWALVIYGGYRIVARIRGKAVTSSPAPAGGQA